MTNPDSTHEGDWAPIKATTALESIKEANRKVRKLLVLDGDAYAEKVCQVLANLQDAQSTMDALAEQMDKDASLPPNPEPLRWM